MLFRSAAQVLQTARDQFFAMEPEYNNALELDPDETWEVIAQRSEAMQGQPP